MLFKSLSNLAGAVLPVALAFLLVHTDVATSLPNAVPNVIPVKAGIHSLTAKTNVT